jgi:hypothetical protein
MGAIVAMIVCVLVSAHASILRSGLCSSEYYIFTCNRYSPNDT